MRGTVVDSITSVPLPGAHVFKMEAGLPVGTTTDLNGQWEFPFDELDVLTYTYVGYTDEVRPAQDGQTVALEPGVMLDEVVITPEVPSSGKSWPLAVLLFAGLLLAISVNTNR